VQFEISVSWQQKVLPSARWPWEHALSDTGQTRRRKPRVIAMGLA
jgi:hypothetical protein